MKRVKEYIALVIVSIFLGIILSIQFKTINKTVGEGVMPAQRAQQLAIELKKAQNEREAQGKIIEELETKIKQYEKGEIDKNVYAETLYNDTMKYRMLAGYLDVEGPGIIMEINDPPVDLEFGDGYSISDELGLVLQVISILNAADAEAISINDQRYTAFTEIEKAGNHIEINGVSTSTPIVIKAIGKPETLESALNLKGGIVTQLRDYDYLVHVRQEPSINISKYRKIKEFIYSSPLEQTAN
ncbi:DUF881 domain-containing protein [Tissierella pigra]|uniref:DUF881 domain-containing protein n=1 Tax=Tissierella pigra TaxID=2607614 RepID=A0A6N7XXX1_9FIRM|nr:DUF881 domain-containing protein [Tissierella pigra]MBU5426791.1 DUF881 domain-containing protein [Tissierella pigra]MSU01335.1 DUF881 domain-containing protein [Tissierella pigra]